MLQVASRALDDDRTDPFEPIGQVEPRRAFSSAPPAAARYGSDARPNLPAILSIVLAHGLLLALFLQVRNDVQRRQDAKLTVVNLTPPSPPPPAADTPPPPAQPEVAAPAPMVRTPVAVTPQVQTTPVPVAVAATPAAAPPSPAPVASPPAPPAPPAIVQASDLGAQMVSGRPPRYPIESRRKREQGTVSLALVLDLDGSVESIGIAQSSGFPRLDDAARDAVRGWRWKPTLRGGQPVRVRGTVDIPFVLKSGAA